MRRIKPGYHSRSRNGNGVERVRQLTCHRPPPNLVLFVTFDFASPLLKRGGKAPTWDLARQYTPRLEQGLQATKCPFERYGVAFLELDGLHTFSKRAGDQRSGNGEGQLAADGRSNRHMLNFRSVTPSAPRMSCTPSSMCCTQIVAFVTSQTYMRHNRRRIHYFPPSNIFLKSSCALP